MEGYWPTADQDPAAPPPIVEFARIWRDMPKVVYSRTLDRSLATRKCRSEISVSLAEFVDGHLPMEAFDYFNSIFTYGKGVVLRNCSDKHLRNGRLIASRTPNAERMLDQLVQQVCALEEQVNRLCQVVERNQIVVIPTQGGEQHSVALAMLQKMFRGGKQRTES